MGRLCETRCQECSYCKVTFVLASCLSFYNSFAIYFNAIYGNAGSSEQRRYEEFITLLGKGVGGSDGSVSELTKRLF